MGLWPNHIDISHPYSAGGNIFHGAMGLDSLFLMRPVKGWYATLDSSETVFTIHDFD